MARVKRPLATAAAAALVLPLTVASVAPAAATTVLVDRGWPPYPGSGYQPYGYVSPYATTSSLDTTEATAEQSAGLVTISFLTLPLASCSAPKVVQQKVLPVPAGPSLKVSCLDCIDRM